MKRNIEIKAYCRDPEHVRRVCREAGAARPQKTRQVDTYFRVVGGRFKLREDEQAGSSLIHYRRPASPLPKESDYEKRDLTREELPLTEYLERALGTRARVDKRREVFLLDSALVNLDEVAGLGPFVEIEVDVAASGGEQNARRLADSLADSLGLTPADLIPWSYAEILAMKESAAGWREKRAESKNPGTLYLLDGASCSGKTTLMTRILKKRGDVVVAYVPRHCTRDPRPGERDGDEYLFVTREQFQGMAASGAFIEYRDFEFGMSYGLSWERSFSHLLSGRDALGVMNLGSVRHVKEVFPEAVTILIDAPEETIRARLLGRGINKPHEIEERLGNARRVRSYRPYYDHVLANDEGKLDRALAELLAIMAPGED